MNLVIVESPTKEKTISKFLKGKDFTVKSSYGHVRDLPEKELGVNIAKNFQPRYVVLPRSKKIIYQLSKLLPNVKDVYLATDFDREGEAIAWHLVQLLKIDDPRAKRITFHEITPEAIEEAIKNPRKIDMALVEAQQARRILDRLVGYKLSPLLWRKIAGGLSAGRVQSVAVRFIVERENEIKNFKSQEYWTIQIEVEKDQKKFLCDLVSKKEEKFQKQITYKLFADEYKVNFSSINSKIECDKISEELKTLNYIVTDIEKKQISKNPPPPFTTSSMQQDAFRKFGFSSQKTMHIAQMLYEGVKLDQTIIGLITYMRTDSVSVAKSSQEETRKYIIEKIGKDFVPEKTRIYKTKIKGAQEAHEAIRPTSVYREPEVIKEYLTDEQYKLYKLIWQRFVASQMAQAIYDQITVEITGGDYKFKASGRTLIFPGYLKIYKEDDENETEDSKILPELKIGDSVKLIDIIPKQHFTEPPPRYNEASLIKTLEKYGIGRPSTYAPIIATIQTRKYVKVIDKKFHPTELGITVNNLLKEYFNEIVDINFTAEVEKKLDEIAQRKNKWIDVLNEFYKSFVAKLNIAEEKLQERQKSVLTDKNCPICGAKMYLRQSKFGKFYSCSKWPKCKGKLNA
ncbi:MAG: type I DNA topoisomerase [Endomicrobiia bacterium]